MIAAGSSPSATTESELVGHCQGLIEVVETDLHRDLLPLRPDLDLVAEGGLESVGRVSQGGGLLRVHFPPSPACFLWLAGQLNPVLGLAHGPAGADGVAGKAAADVV